MTVPARGVCQGRGRPSAQDTAGSEGRDALAVLLSAFARTVQQQRDPSSTLVEVVRAAVELVPGCDEGSISVVLGRRRVTSQASSGRLPENLFSYRGRFRRRVLMERHRLTVDEAFALLVRVSQHTNA